MSLITTGSSVPATPAPTYNNPLMAYPLVDGMLKATHFSLYCKKEQSANPPSLYQRLLGMATQTVWIWDSNFHMDDGDILDNVINPNVEIRLITIPKKPLNDYMTQLVNAMNATLMGIGRSLRIVQAKESYAEWKMHDRFLIIDQAIVYIIGGSVGYYRKVSTSTGAYEVTDTADKQLIIDAFSHYWKQLDVPGNAVYITL